MLDDDAHGVHLSLVIHGEPHMPPFTSPTPGRRVSKDEFYATVGRLNVHPRSERDASYWETPGRVLKGVTTPGYMCVGETAYFVVGVQ